MGQFFNTIDWFDGLQETTVTMQYTNADKINSQSEQTDVLPFQTQSGRVNNDNDTVISEGFDLLSNSVMPNSATTANEKQLEEDLTRESVDHLQTDGLPSQASGRMDIIYENDNVISDGFVPSSNLVTQSCSSTSNEELFRNTEEGLTSGSVDHLAVAEGDCFDYVIFVLS